MAGKRCEGTGDGEMVKRERVRCFVLRWGRLRFDCLEQMTVCGAARLNGLPAYVSGRCSPLWTVI